MIEFGAERLSEIREELKELIGLHWEEIAVHKDKIPLDPDWEKYAAYDKQGNIVFITCRDGGKLIGYSVWFINHHMHYKRTLFALNDIVFIKKEYRKGRNGINLIKFSEYMMKALGADKILWHVKVSNDWTNILRRLGYDNEDIVMGKVV
jgi:hypothetical protein